MSDRQIVYLTDAKLITCVLQNGLAEKVLDARSLTGWLTGWLAGWLAD